MGEPALSVDRTLEGAVVTRLASPRARLVTLGFADPARALTLLQDTALAGLVDPFDDVYADGLPDALASAADPDQALLGLVRLVEALSSRTRKRGRPPVDTAGLLATLRHAGPGRSRLLAVLGASTALTDHLVSHPEQWPAAALAVPRSAEQLRTALLTSVSVAGRGDRSAYDALRVAYRAELLTIAAIDLTSPDPVTHLPRAAESLAWLAEAALEAGLAIAREEYGPGHDDCRLAIIGMGKTGGGELNYVSDVDVIFVAEPADGVAEERALAIGTALATGTMKACSASTGEGTLWPVDPALRPEGKQGPLVRTVASHRAYYERWAKTWEFQALLKAWVSAGDLQVGKAYKEAIVPLVWAAAGRANFVQDVQAMRRRVESHVPAAEAPRQLKLGPGGLRDVEFSVQLLQLVHGRTDESLRSATTLEALAALAKAGYVGRDDAAVLDESYRLLRTLEHRIQLYRLRRTHLMPTAPAELRRLGRSIGLMRDPEDSVVALREAKAREVRRIHERLFYRPLLAAVAKLGGQESRLSPEAARARLQALGFRDPAGALRHMETLTLGVSRRAAIQRTLLPVMLSWFADEADPDAGLLAFRRVSDELGSIHWFLKMLRDEGQAAERLAHVLGRSRFAADLLVRSPESVAFLGDDSGLRPRTRDELRTTMSGAVARKSESSAAMAAILATRRHEVLRTAFADLIGLIDVRTVGQVLAGITAATLDAGLAVAMRSISEQFEDPLGIRLIVVGMGSLGGGEMGYASDADVLFVYAVGEPDHQVQPVSGGEGGGHGPAVLDEASAAARALLVVQEFLRLFKSAASDPSIGVNADLRPEGKSGPLVRSLAAYRTYYERWALTWEYQALVRAAPVAGDDRLAEDFMALADTYRWPTTGLTADQERQIRTMKARVEAERLPRGADPKLHFKLGRGGLTDVEWTVQLLQMQHAATEATLRTPNTLDALDAAEACGLIDPTPASDLRAAWVNAAALRNAGILWRGRTVESLPTDVRDVDGMGRIVGFAPGSTDVVPQTYLHTARRARHAMEAVFYGAVDEPGGSLT